MKIDNERIVCIDRFRGALVFSMIFFQYLERFSCYGILSRFAHHTPSLGIEVLPNFTIADFIASCFFLVISLNFKPSFERTLTKKGKKDTYLKFIKRDLILIGFGSCMSAADNVFAGAKDWYLTVAAVLTILCIIFGLLYVITKCFTKTRNFSEKVNSVFTFILILSGLLDFLYCFYASIFYTPENNLYTQWGVLQAIGGASLVSLLFIESSTISREIWGVLMMIAYALVHSIPGMFLKIDAFVQGGFFGTFSWASMMLMFSVFADFFYYDRKEAKKGKKTYRYLIATIVADFFGILASKFLYLDRGTVNTGFVILTIAISVTLFGLIALTDNYKPRFAFFVWWGENPLILFLFQYLLTNIPLSLIPNTESWGPVTASIYGIFLFGFITFYVYKLDKIKESIRL